jgi:sigma-B regulation protein RsbU (phosphoserine phosphatase)
MAKILLVDDSEANRHMLARRLQRRGFAVVVAADGRQGLDAVRSESPDLILMDLNLPVLDGWQVTRQIKSSPDTTAIPVIALTAHAMSGDRQKALDAGCDDYDTKPIDLPRLLAKMDALLGRPASPKGAAVAAVPADRQPPAAATTPENGEADAGSPAAAGRATEGGRLLVVDDTEANRDMVAQRLTRNGFTVDVAAGGLQALDLLSRHAYDAVLLDVMMPGIDGLEVLRTIRRTHTPTDLPVIMATARGVSDDVVEALDLGANDYVTKPLDFPVVLARVRTQLSLKRAVEQIRRLEQGLEQRNRELQSANTLMHRDLDAAAKVQAALLPAASPQVPGYRCAWLFKPCAGVAGDIFNVFSLDGQHVGLYVLDVSGHGVAAALLSVTVSRFLSPNPDPSSLLWHRPEGSEACRLETPPNVAERLSRRFPFNNATCQYFTLVYGILDVGTNRLRYVSAGHPNLVYVPATGDGRIVPAAGYPVGVGSDPYDEYAIDLGPGDRLYVHSDGVSEALNTQGETFGERRMLKVLADARDRPLDQTLTLLSEAVTRWSGNGEAKDDQTVLALERSYPD